MKLYKSPYNNMHTAYDYVGTHLHILHVTNLCHLLLDMV